MRRRVKKVIDQLCREGLSMAFIETPAGNFVYPSIKDPPKYGKKYLILLVVLVFIFTVVGGIKILDRRQVMNQQKNINRTDLYGMSLLFHAVMENDLEKVKTLVQSGASVNIQDHYGWSPLHWAVFNENAGICRYLIQQGADIHTETARTWFKFPQNLTPGEMAGIIQNEEITGIIRTNMKKNNRKRGE